MENRVQKCTRSLRTNWTIKLKGRKNMLAPKISSTDRETSKNNVKICPSNLKKNIKYICEAEDVISNQISFDDFTFCGCCHRK